MDDSSPHDEAAVQTLSVASDVASRRKSIAKAPMASPFSRLPREIIQQILYLTDPNTFASLTLLNSTWLRASLSAPLYAHQLRSCGVAFPPGTIDTELPLNHLIQQFGVESRRALFVSVLAPATTTYHLLSASPSSTSALPGGESLRFVFSPSGKSLLAISSARIFVLSLTSGVPTVDRELKLARRPVSAAILDDGSILAILFQNHRVSFYDLLDKSKPSKYLRSMTLDHPPRAIALSPRAAVLACAYDHGIEVYSLHPIRSDDGPAVDARRAVKCDAVDDLTFSPDGTVLLGTTTVAPESPSAPTKKAAPATTTVAISAPFIPLMEGQPDPAEYLSQIWTTQLLFPRSSRDSSHAVLLSTPEKPFLPNPSTPPANENRESCLDWDTDVDTSEMTWTFAHDSVFGTFRAVRLDDLRNGHTYFTGPPAANSASMPNPGSRTTLSSPGPATVPASKSDGTLCATGFGPSGSVYVYGIPSRLDLSPRNPSNEGDPSGPSTGAAGSASSLGRSNSNGGAWSAQAAMDAATATEPGSVLLPQLQGLCDRYRNVFLAGRQVGADVTGLQAMKWVKTMSVSGSDVFENEKLVAVANGSGSDEAVWGSNEDFEMMHAETASRRRDSSMSSDFGEHSQIMPMLQNSHESDNGGRIIVYDFARSPGGPYKETVVMELGLGDIPGVIVENLKEVLDDIETEVDLVRRRTVAARARAAAPARGDSNVGRASTSANGRRRGSRGARSRNLDIPHLPDPASRPPPRLEPPITNERREGGDSDEDDAWDQPYGHNEPRARGTLQRAATAAAARNVHTPRTYPLPQTQEPSASSRQYDPRQISYNPALDTEIEYPPPPPYTPAQRPDHISEDVEVDRVVERAATMGIPLERVTSIPVAPAARAATSPSGQLAPPGGLSAALERTRSKMERAGTIMRRGITGDAERRGELQPQVVTSRPRPLGQGFERLHDGGGAASMNVSHSPDPRSAAPVPQSRPPPAQSIASLHHPRPSWPTRSSSNFPPAMNAPIPGGSILAQTGAKPSTPLSFGKSLFGRVKTPPGPTSEGESSSARLGQASSSSGGHHTLRVPSRDIPAADLERPGSVSSLRSLSLHESMDRPLPPPPVGLGQSPPSARQSLDADMQRPVQGHAAYPAHMRSFVERRPVPNSPSLPPPNTHQRVPSTETLSVAPLPQPTPSAPKIASQLAPQIDLSNPLYFNPTPPPIPSPTPQGALPTRSRSRISRSGTLRRRPTASTHRDHARPDRASTRQANDARMRRIMNTVGGQVDAQVQRFAGGSNNEVYGPSLLGRRRTVRHGSVDDGWEDEPERPRFRVKGPNEDTRCVVM